MQHDKRKVEVVLRKATSKGTKNALRALTDPRVINHLQNNQEEHQELHLLINKFLSLWSVTPATDADSNPDRIHVPTTITPAEAIASWKEETEEHYDEIFDGEELRPAYQEVYPIMQTIEQESPERIDAYEKRSLRDFMKDNRLYHIPRMLSIAEHQKLTSGVAQRAKAIQSFLQDYFSNGLDAQCFKEKIIPANTFKQILLRNHEQDFLRKFNVSLANNWGFWYGPDLIRGPTGEMYVCEDNIGFVGGLGDLYCARKSLLNAFPEMEPAIRGDTPKNFYQSICNDYRQMVKSNERIVLLHYPNSITADNEEKRVIKLFHECGVDTVVLDSSQKRKNKRKQKSRTLQVTKDGVFLCINKQAKGKRPAVSERHPVGLVIIDAEPFDVDPKNSSVRKKIILDEAQYWMEFYDEKLESFAKLPPNKKKWKRVRIQKERDELNSLLNAKRKQYGKIANFLREYRRKDLKEALEQGFSGILDCYYNGKLQIINGPGFDFLGDKLFCMFVTDLIRFYLKEEPIISEIPTFSFADKNGQLDQALFQAVFNDPFAQQRLVLKRVDGRGGDAVWVGPMIPRAEFESVQEKIQAEPGAFIVQKYLALSVVDNQLVDLRNLANVTPQNIVVSDVLWGRGV
eukprot:CAMPEP_0206195462 /NCGR_PEP_ID=MMETSP0166-20121206/7849_1 /ASSEMBLY_ACC=CAM_ASM_000260 /TAXON_ID=95228 /ORGANISM="Vannella robusta, Strain DIVA3 518/3/11/1/6" /LENGTH=628 /DNA_ID=CAMNT_0053612715 /DNA_START=23 /DNA_END=1905 /DNA_ORIENTATION=-